jgi:vesicle transport through interaction with t-SNAREs protein 1
MQELGISVLSDLQRQRESILHSRDTLGTVDANIGKAREILAVMSRRIIQNKIIMWGVIALLAGAIGLVIWAKIA